GRRRVHLLPFTQHIAPLMAAAEVVMGKAAPNVLFEAVTLGKPFIATTFIPGQEAGNLGFIRQHGLGWVALSAPEQQALARRLMAEPHRLSAMRASTLAYRQWNTAATE